MQGTQHKMLVSYSIHTLYSIVPTYFVLLVRSKIFVYKYVWLMLTNDAFIKLIWFVKKETVTFPHSFEYGDCLFHCIIKKVNWKQITKRTVSCDVTNSPSDRCLGDTILTKLKLRFAIGVLIPFVFQFDQRFTKHGRTCMLLFCITSLSNHIKNQLYNIVKKLCT